MHAVQVDGGAPMGPKSPDGPSTTGGGIIASALHTGLSLYERRETRSLFLFSLALAAFMLIQGVYGATIDSLGTHKRKTGVRRGCAGGGPGACRCKEKCVLACHHFCVAVVWLTARGCVVSSYSHFYFFVLLMRARAKTASFPPPPPPPSPPPQPPSPPLRDCQLIRRR